MKPIAGYYALVTLLVAPQLYPQEAPQVKKQVDPTYPALYKAAGIQGQVEVKVSIAEDGKVEKAESVKSSDPGFVPFAVAAAKQWEFIPATQNGKPIKSEAVIPFIFKLGPDSYKSGREHIFKLKEDALRILRGELTEELRSFVDSAAYIVIGNRYEHLRSLLADKRKSRMLIEGKETKVEFSRLWSDSAQQTTYLVLKTAPAPKQPHRFHTIVFMEHGGMKIQTWHMSR